VQYPARHVRRYRAVCGRLWAVRFPFRVGSGLTMYAAGFEPAGAREEPAVNLCHAVSCSHASRLLPQPLPGQSSDAACHACPEFSSTRNRSSTNITDCLCSRGFIRSAAAGGQLVCQCGPGFEISNGVQCMPCPTATFKATIGNTKCSDCPVRGTTTRVPGAASFALCVCGIGTFANVTYQMMLTSAYECRQCTTTHYLNRVSQDMTNCTSLNVTLDRLPIIEGYWRQSATSEVPNTSAAQTRD
jgi:hypothetical protein